ncbi:hypothetical protein EUTSA_v10000491mg, partial [Eutrema salsugineum]
IFVITQKVSFKPLKPSQTKSDFRITLNSRVFSRLRLMSDRPLECPMYMTTTSKSSLGSSRRFETFCYPQKFPFKPSKTSQAKPDQVYQKPIQTLRELFAGSVTMGAAPSPRHVPVPMFCFTEKFN